MAHNAIKLCDARKKVTTPRGAVAIEKPLQLQPHVCLVLKGGNQASQHVHAV